MIIGTTATHNPPSHAFTLDTPRVGKPMMRQRGGRKHLHRTVSNPYSTHHDWSPTILWCMSTTALAIVVVTLLPFSFDTSMHNASSWFGLWTLVWGGSPTGDLVANVLAYIPLGMLISLAARPIIRRRSTLWLFSTMLAFMLCLTLEWLQTMISSRVASWTDVCTNTIGGTCGAAIGAHGHLIRRARIAFVLGLRVHPLKRLTAIAAIGLVAYHLIPFDVVTSTSDLRRSLAQSNFWPIGDWHAQHGGVAPDASAWFAWLTDALPFAVLGALATLARFHRPSTILFDRRRPRNNATTAFIEVAAVALSIELLQLFVISHAFELMDLFAAIAGGGLGILLAIIFQRQSIPKVFQDAAIRRGLLALVTLVLGITLVGASQVSPIALSDFSLPLVAQFNRPYPVAIADILETTALFTLLATLIRLLLGHATRSHRLITMVPAIIVAACLIECFPMLIRGGTADLTTPAIAMFVAVTLAMWEPGPIDLHPQLTANLSLR